MYPNLNAEMSRYNITQKSICNILGINTSTLSDKMTGKKDFKLSECKKIKETYFKNLCIDYLFSEKAVSNGSCDGIQESENINEEENKTNID